MILFFLFTNVWASENPFQSQTSPVKLEAGVEGSVDFLLLVPDGFHLYRDMMHVEVLSGAPLQFQEARYPVGLFKPDPANPKAFREQYNQNLTVSLPVQHSTIGQYEATFEIAYQGCRGGLCYRPAKDVHVVSIDVVPQGADTEKEPAPAQAPLSPEPAEPAIEPAPPAKEASIPWPGILGAIIATIATILVFRKTRPSQE